MPWNYCYIYLDSLYYSLSSEKTLEKMIRIKRRHQLCHIVKKSIDAVTYSLYLVKLMHIP